MSLEGSLAVALAEGNTGTALGLIFLGGLATSLTGCVYPMIIITVSVFGARQAKSRWQGAALSTVFVLGIATVLTPLGVLAGVSGSSFGDPLANPWVVGAMSLLFALLGIGMLGAYDIALPPALQNRIASVGGTGYKGAFALGSVCAVVAAPCTGPVLIALLTWLATTRDIAFGALSMFTYALGLGLIFWVVGTFAISLPKSGRWLDWTKSFFGAVMITVAFFYARDLLNLPRPADRSTSFLLFALASMVLAIALGAIHLSYYGASILSKARKTLGVALFVTGLLAVVLWLEAPPKGAKIHWLDDYHQARELALKQHRPMLVDFGANWCGACGELDRDTFSNPHVIAEAQRFIPVRIDLSLGKATPQKWKLLKDYHQAGLPLVVLHRSDGSESTRVTTFMPPEQFIRQLRKAH